MLLKLIGVSLAMIVADSNKPCEVVTAPIDVRLPENEDAAEAKILYRDLKSERVPPFLEQEDLLPELISELTPRRLEEDPGERQSFE